MNFKEELQYLYDKIQSVDIVRLDIYFLNSLRGFINSNCTHQGFKHDLELTLNWPWADAKMKLALTVGAKTSRHSVRTLTSSSAPMSYTTVPC